ncbi:CRISPR-associated endonuclease Cas1 [Methanococcoides orientis]|uniref:CRISPR-associated endonuclease Cas1 n=1 Tax=Methanococcoides orientis TaxID=2822137 RepID=UPI001E640729|nr:CRISPR-associated endonuclease Cas1 [Methanococcoides orientis]
MEYRELLFPAFSQEVKDLKFGEKIESDFSDDKAKLENAKSIREILGIEGGIAWKYWNEYAKAVPNLEASISFTLRLTENAPNSIVPIF